MERKSRIAFPTTRIEIEFSELPVYLRVANGIIVLPTLATAVDWPGVMTSSNGGHWWEFPPRHVTGPTI